MKNMLERTLTGLLFIVVLSACSSALNVGDQQEKIVLGYLLPSEAPELTEGVDALGEALGNQIRRKIEAKAYDDINDLLKDLQLGNTHLTYTGPISYAMLSEITVLYPLAAGSYGTHPFTNTAIITLLEQPWNSLDELIAEADQIAFSLSGYNSVTGYLVPLMELTDREAITSPREHRFKQLTISSKHETTARGVVQGVFEAGAVDSRVLDYLIDTGYIDGETIKRIWVSPAIYSNTFAAAETLDKETIAQLRRAILDLQEADHAFYEQLGIGQFISVQQQHYLYTRQIAYKNKWLNWESEFANE